MLLSVPGFSVSSEMIGAILLATTDGGQKIRNVQAMDGQFLASLPEADADDLERQWKAVPVTPTQKRVTFRRVTLEGYWNRIEYRTVTGDPVIRKEGDILVICGKRADFEE